MCPEIVASPTPLERFDHRRVSDAVFARAYARLGDARRALLKRAIARLYALHGAEPHHPATVAATLSGALSRVRRTRPRQRFVLVLEPQAASPALLLAALMPAIVRRIPYVAVLRPRAGSPWPDAQLTALELCGVENVYSPVKGEFADCLRAVYEPRGACGLACLGGEALFRRVLSLAGAPEGGDVHRFEASPTLGLWAGDGATWDQEALRLAHPDATIRVFGGQIEGFVTESGGMEALNAAGLDAAFVPGGIEPVRAPLALGPGFEVFWHFSDASPVLYEERSETFQPDPV